MTAQEAQTFPNGKRITSYERLLWAREARAGRGEYPDCQCEPYRDWYTFRRWLAQGYVVRRGEHGVKLPAIISVEDEDDEGEVRMRTRPGVTVVMCRCQVVPK
ncbi:MAG: hypothetical protein ABIH46_07390 [Chloroflexota bacterium]